MGPRSFVSRRITKFLLRHGDLDRELQLRAESACLDQRAPPAPDADASARIRDPAHDAYGSIDHVLGLAPEHSPRHVAILLVASLAIMRRLKKERKRHAKRSSQLVSSSSCKSSRLTDALDAMPLAIVRAATLISVILAGMLAVSSFLGDASVVPWLVSRTRWTREIEERYMFACSLWSVLVSVLLIVASAVWSALDTKNPMTGPSRTATDRRNVLAKAHTHADTALFVLSVVAIVFLAYARMPLFHRALHGEFDFGLPPRASRALEQVLASFFGFCLFHKLIPRPMEHGLVSADNTRAARHAADLELLCCMSAFTEEAKERACAQRDAMKQPMSTSSKGNSSHCNITSSSQDAPLSLERGQRPSGLVQNEFRLSLASFLKHGDHEERANRQWAQHYPAPQRSISFCLERPLRDIRVLGLHGLRTCFPFGSCNNFVSGLYPVLFVSSSFGTTSTQKEKKQNYQPFVDWLIMHSPDQTTSPASTDTETSIASAYASKRVVFKAMNYCKSHTASMKAIKALGKERWDTKSRTPDKGILRSQK